MKRTLLVKFLILIALGVNAQEKPPLTWKELSKWNSNKMAALSPDGAWFANASGPVEGNQTVTIRRTLDTTKYVIPTGATLSPILFSKDSKYAGFRITAKEAEVKAAKKTNKTLYDKLVLLTLPGNKQITFERVRNFAFSGETPNWVAIHFVAPEGSPKGPDAGKGTDLLLYNMNTKASYNMGNVSEFAFNRSGNKLVYVIDASGQNGNGVFMRDMATGLTTALDNDKASYKNIGWNEEGDAFAMLKSAKNDKYKSEVFTALGFTNLNGDLTTKTSFSSIDQSGFPDGMGVSGNGRAFWSDDKSTLFVGISKLERAPEKATDSAKKTATPPAANADLEKPDMIIWNWQDKRLQSAQQVQEMMDKNFSYLTSYNVTTKTIKQLADSNMRNVSIAPKGFYAIGYDNSEYELMSNLDGQNYSDIYVIDLKTGHKKQVLKKYYQNNRGGFTVAPNGKWAAFYKDGVFYSMNLETRQEHNLTGKINASFIDEWADNNVDKPATQNFGWTADSKFILIKDNYDLWKISADGKSVTPLTDNWKDKSQRVAQRSRIYPFEKGADLSKDQYFTIFNPKTKDSGLGILEAGKNNIRVLYMDNQVYESFTKAEKGNGFIFTKENATTAPEYYYTSTANLASPAKITTNTPDQQKYAFSSGVKLIEFTSGHGDKLQATLYLPANYVEGKSYPTITYIYERLTDNMNRYTMPGFPSGGFNASMYTSNGYAVLMPDIKYKMNDPGMSAVACVIPAVKAAIATGIVDAKNVAIHGHSWGGYQTSFLITQTDMFKAAAAGAPLTNMISMYSLIYWNSGSTNQSIFESSQGRLTPGYWDNWDAFTRNSPIYYIKNVNTPLLLLHNDKDGAVDYTQGVEYYNGLRRLNKPVVMITYKGENHGIAKLPNRKDYAVRMMEYFDYFLKGKEAPDWWSKGVNKLDLDKHLDSRVFE